MASDFRDDLFGDDFDDDFDDGGFDDAGFDDDLGGFEDDGFEDEFGGLGLDDDEDFGDFDEDFSDEFAATSGGGNSGGGPSTAFIIIAVIMIILLLGALGLIGYLVIIAPASPAELTSTAIVATNDARQVLAEQTATKSKENLDNTMTAEAYTDTPTPSPTPSDTPTPTEDTSAQLTAAFQSTLDAANVLATETAIAATETLGAQLNPPEVVTEGVASPTPLGQVTENSDLVGTSVADGGATATMPSGQAVELSAVQMTATALADILVNPTASSGTAISDGGAGGGEATPTIEVVGASTPTGSGSGGSTNLPDTGLFDDVFGGNPLTIFLAAFGLLGVIVVSRRLRGANRKRK